MGRQIVCLQRRTFFNRPSPVCLFALLLYDGPVDAIIRLLLAIVNLCLHYCVSHFAPARSDVQVKRYNNAFERYARAGFDFVR